MKQQMIYEESEEFPIQTLSIIGEFNEWQKEGVPFEKMNKVSGRQR